ncbi:MAG: adenylosuccinate lyase [Deltaproteobacteria bacterium]|nr:adenylosuccinate lyase [Deltaproteobacteria bacterium]
MKVKKKKALKTKSPKLTSSSTTKVSADQTHNQYRNILGSRYASPAMSAVFSERHRAEIWRDLWIILASEEQKLGLPISSAQVEALKKAKKDIDFDRIREIETKLKHDVMSHLKAYAEKAKEAEPIMHLGATSAFITDNADALLLKEGAVLILQKLGVILESLGSLMLTYKNLETTGFTHFQPAQPVTVGKRFALWAQDLLWDYEELEFALQRLEPLGCKGTTGTQASFAVLFKNDFKKVKALDDGVCKQMGFDRAVALSGQTLSRKVDVWFLQALANLGASFSKMSYDMRLLQHLREVTEPFAEKQIGSSAMPYKQNPMLAERITGLSRFLMGLSSNANWTFATQWLERSLDDSSNRRLTLPEAFLTADALCESAHRLLKGVQVHKTEIKNRIDIYAAQFETEALMMEGTLKGGSRQKIHEEIRQQMLKGKLNKKGIKYSLSGFASEQVQDFHKNILSPFLKSRKKSKGVSFNAAAI